MLSKLLSLFLRKTIRMVASFLPEYKTPGSAGFDLYIIEDYSLSPGELHNFHTGVRMDIPENYCVLVFPRSSLGQKKVIIPNSAGVIDSDYRGEVKVPLLNLSNETLEFKAGQRIAQGIILPAKQCNIVRVDSLTETLRGSGGFGSTGI